MKKKKNVVGYEVEKCVCKDHWEKRRNQKQVAEKYTKLFLFCGNESKTQNSAEYVTSYIQLLFTDSSEKHKHQLLFCSHSSLFMNLDLRTHWQIVLCFDCSLSAWITAIKHLFLAEIYFVPSLLQSLNQSNNFAYQVHVVSFPATRISTEKLLRKNKALCCYEFPESY